MFVNNRTLTNGLRLTAVLVISGFLIAVWVTGGAALADISITSVGQFADDSYPSSLVYGPQESVWFTLFSANELASYTPPTAIITLPITTTAAGLFDITMGPNKNLWFTEQFGNKIGNYQIGAGISEYSLPAANAKPSQITLGHDDTLWFTELEGNKVGRITADGDITEYSLPNADSKPLGIATALDGNIWFTEWNGYRLGKLTPKGQLSEFAIPNAVFHPTEIVVGPDGNLWFIFEIGKKVVRVDPQTGEMTTYNLPTQSSALTDLAIGPDGKMWFLGIQTIGRFDVTPDGPENLEEEPLLITVFEGEGRSQLIAGPGPEMYFVTLNSQDIYKATSDTLLRDLQLFVTHIYPMVLAAGEFDLQVEIVNWSSNPATGVQIDLPLDENILFVDVDTAGASCTATDDHATCQLPDIPGGGVLPIIITLRTERVKPIVVERTLVLEVSNAEGDYLPANNRMQHYIEVRRSFDYSNDFSGGADPYWSHSTVTSLSGLTYLGLFDNDLVSLNIPDLPPHNEAWICFDLYVLGKWDGDQIADPFSKAYPPPVIGPDLWAFYMNGSPLQVTTFSNQPVFLQTYPRNYPAQGEGYQAQSVASETGNFNGVASTLDARYFICNDWEHLTADFLTSFYGVNVDPLAGERWALDNVSVKIYYRVAYDRPYIPLVINQD